MYEIAKRTAGGALLLLLMPLAVWVSGWHWQPGGNDRLLKALYWVTETVTSPWGILTSAILCGWFLWCLRFRLKPAIGLAMLLFAALLIGQGVKSLIKDRVQEPRPFVVWLEQTHGVDGKYFYSLQRKSAARWCASNCKTRRWCRAGCASTGSLKPALLFRRGTPCSPPPGRYWA